MHITWHGDYTVKLQSGETTLVLDPHGSGGDLTPFRGKADIVALSNPSSEEMSSLSGIQGEPLLIDSPGEYSVGGFGLLACGWHNNQGQEQTIQRWTVEQLVILYIGARPTPLTNEELSQLESTDIDILLLPVGGGSGLDAAGAVALATTIEPRVIIPIHFAPPKGAEGKLESITAFAKEIGMEKAKAEKKFIAKAAKLPTEDMVTVLLSAS